MLIIHFEKILYKIYKYNHPVLQSQVFSEKKEEETKTCKKHINDKNIKKATHIERYILKIQK